MKTEKLVESGMGLLLIFFGFLALIIPSLSIMTSASSLYANLENLFTGDLARWYIIWFLTLIIGYILLSVGANRIKEFRLRKVVGYCLMIVGCVMLISLLIPLLGGEINMLVVFLYLPFVINGGIILYAGHEMST